MTELSVRATGAPTDAHGAGGRVRADAGDGVPAARSRARAATAVEP